MITWLIIGVTALVSYVAFQNTGLMNKLQFNAAQIIHKKEYYRLISHAFIHANWPHLIVNMLVLYFFGRAIEVYLGYFFPGLAEGATLTPLGVSLAVIILWIFTIINILGVKWGGLYAIVTTIGKLIPLLIFVLVGFMYFKGANFSPFIPFGLTGLTLSITLFFWSYTGFEAIVVPSEEIKNPSRTIPLSMILTILITIFVYMVIAIAFVGMINWKFLGIASQNWAAISEISSHKLKICSQS